MMSVRVDAMGGSRELASGADRQTALKLLRESFGDPWLRRRLCEGTEPRRVPSSLQLGGERLRHVNRVAVWVAPRLRRSFAELARE